MYEQSPIQQPQLSSLDRFGQPQTAGTRESAQQATGQPQFAQQPQQVAGVKQQPVQQYSQQPQTQQSPIQQGQQAPVQQSPKQSPIQQGQQAPVQQYGQQSPRQNAPAQQSQQAPIQQGLQSPQQAPTQYGQPQQFGETMGIRGQQSVQPVGQQFQQPSQYGNTGAQVPSWGQTPQLGQRTQNVKQSGQMPQQFGQVPQQTGQSQQIPVGGSQQIPVEYGQQTQQSPWQSFGQHERLHQAVEMADTPTLADALARRLGVTSQQLAQVLPQLGAALKTQAQGQQSGIVGQQTAMPQQGQLPIHGAQR